MAVLDRKKAWIGAIFRSPQPFTLTPALSREGRGGYAIASLPRLLETMCVVVGVALVVLLFASRMDPLGPKPDWDRPIDYHKYLFMARHPLELRTAPYAHRLLVPAVLGQLPEPLEISAMVLNAVMVGGTLLIIYATMGALGAGALLGAVALLSAAAVGPFMRGGLAGYPSVDPTSWFLIALGVLLIVTHRDVWLAILLMLGALNKESVLLVAALYYGWHAARVVDVRRLLLASLVALPAFTVFIAVRWAMPALNDDPAYLEGMPVELTHVQQGTAQYGFVWCLVNIGLPRLAGMTTAKFWYDVTLTPFGPLLLVVVWGALVSREIRVLALRCLPFALLVFATMFFAVDTGRLLVPLVPVFAILAALSLSKLAAHCRQPSVLMLLLPTVQLLAILLLPPRDERYFSFHQTSGVLAVFAAATIGLRARWPARCRGPQKLAPLAR